MSVGGRVNFELQHSEWMLNLAGDAGLILMIDVDDSGMELLPSLHS